MFWVPVEWYGLSHNLSGMFKKYAYQQTTVENLPG